MKVHVYKIESTSYDQETEFVHLPIFTFTKLYMLLDTEYNKTNQIPGEN